MASPTAASSIKKQDSGSLNPPPATQQQHQNQDSANEYEADEFEKDDLVQMAEPTTSNTQKQTAAKPTRPNKINSANPKNDAQ